tara:strand:+ start:2375 stop:3382 length:1008 start_codon:yes stop_codon:yes gene_type:complete
MKILITGSSGFIGSALVKALDKKSYEIIGVDNHSDYYSISLKKDRLSNNQESSYFSHHDLDICDFDSLQKLFDEYKPNIVIHLAAQVGVRYSLENPRSYIDTNLVGFNNVIQLSKEHSVSNFIYASSSSVYGGNTTVPYSTLQNVDHPISLYAATKKSNELIAHTYSHLYQLPTTGLRFFTVYGPWGRPDMAPFIFLKSILEGKTIDINNDGNHRRSFTYIDDITEAIRRLLEHPARANEEWDSNFPLPNSSNAPWEIYNIGAEKTVELMDFIEILEKKTNIDAKKNFLPIQPGDVLVTDADCSDLEEKINFIPQVSIEDGLSSFINWYRDYYKI